MNAIHFIKKYYNLSAPDINLLNDKLEPLSISKKEIIQQEGFNDFNLYFIEKGLVRSYITREGKEVTIMINTEGKLSLSTHSLTSVSPSYFSLQALEDCLLWKISRHNLKEILNQSNSLTSWALELTGNILKENNDYYLHMYWMNKSEQYKYLLSNYPKLIRRLSVGDVATWLNITPQSLSRIRAEID